jgi:hypothetical protein
MILLDAGTCFNLSRLLAACGPREFNQSELNGPKANLPSLLVVLPVKESPGKHSLLFQKQTRTFMSMTNIETFKPYQITAFGVDCVVVAESDHQLKVRLPCGSESWLSKLTLHYRPGKDKASSMTNTPSKTAHTPGPWTIVPQSGAGPMIAHPYETGNQLNPHGLRLVCHVLARYNSLEQDNSNARLIAAAPDLLQSLKLCVARLEEYQDAEGGIALEFARAAITKAGGAE